MKRPRFGALLFLAVLLGSASKGIGVENPVVLWSLIKDSDAIIDGTVVDERSVDMGVWHKVRINDTIWGDTPGSLVDVFVYGPDVPESVTLSAEDRGIMGLRWISMDGGTFQQELLASTENVEIAALVAVDAVVFVENAETRAQLGESIRVITSTVRSKAGPTEDELREVAGLLDDENPNVREAVLRALNEIEAAIPPSVVPELQKAFDEEASVHQNEDVLRSYFDIIRKKGLDLDSETVCRVVIGHEKTTLASEGIEALRHQSSDEVLGDLLAHYPTGTPAERGRIIRALSRLEWSGVVSLCQQALETDDWDVHVSVIESLGHVEAEEATHILIETIEFAKWPFRKLALESLTRQRTAHSFRALRNLLDEIDLFDSERRFVKRHLLNAKGCLDRGLKN